MEQERVESPRDRDWLVLFPAGISQPPAIADGEREWKELPVGLGSKGNGGPVGAVLLCFEALCKPKPAQGSSAESEQEVLLSMCGKPTGDIHPTGDSRSSVIPGRGVDKGCISGSKSEYTAHRASLSIPLLDSTSPSFLASTAQKLGSFCSWPPGFSGQHLPLIVLVSVCLLETPLEGSVAAKPVRVELTLSLKSAFKTSMVSALSQRQSPCRWGHHRHYVIQSSSSQEREGEQKSS